MKIHYGNPTGPVDLRQILELQRANLPANISEAELREQGFVTVQHTEELLAEMNAAEPQVIAKDGEAVVGYALVMLREFSTRIPILIPMFEMLETLSYRGRPLSEWKYYVVGQLCVAKSHRGRGLVEGMYKQHRRQLSDRYDFVVTKISDRNPRSLRAHCRAGFETIHRYTEADGETWDIVLWDWQ